MSATEPHAATAPRRSYRQGRIAMVVVVTLLANTVLPYATAVAVHGWYLDEDLLWSTFLATMIVSLVVATTFASTPRRRAVGLAIFGGVGLCLLCVVALLFKLAFDMGE